MPKSRIISLSSKEKEYHLQFLSSQIKAGAIDEEFIPYLKQINSIEGVCTTQSCTGHKKNRYQDNGHLRFRLSAKMMSRFQRNIPKFYECRNIGYVDLRYHPGRKYFPTSDETGIYEEIMIDFLGLNRSPEIFRESMEHIVEILKSFEAEKCQRFAMNADKKSLGLSILEESKSHVAREIVSEK